MTSLRFGLLAAGLLGVLGAAPASPPASFAGRKHAVVTIDKEGLHPRTLTLRPDEVVGWLNYSDDTAQIVFPERVADAFRCPSARPGFYEIAGGKLASRPIGTLEFLLPCQLAPGTYPYGVVLSSGTGGILEGLVADPGELPEMALKGEIRVE